MFLCSTENAKLYSKLGVPFVMGTTGGDRQLLHKTVYDANVYAVISPQMGKQVHCPISSLKNCFLIAAFSIVVKKGTFFAFYRLLHFSLPWKLWLSSFLARFQAIL